MWIEKCHRYSFANEGARGPIIVDILEEDTMKKGKKAIESLSVKTHIGILLKSFHRNGVELVFSPLRSIGPMSYHKSRRDN